jgi:hypothetical protein
MVRKKFAKLYIWRRGGRPQGPNAVPHGGSKARDTVAPPTIVSHDGRGPVSFQKFGIVLLESDGGKLYMKIIAFDEIYNFVVQNFSI